MNLMTSSYLYLKQISKWFFCALTITFPFIFLSNLFIAFDTKLLTNAGGGIATFVSAFSPKLAN